MRACIVEWKDGYWAGEQGSEVFAVEFGAGGSPLSSKQIMGLSRALWQLRSHPFMSVEASLDQVTS